MKVKIIEAGGVWGDDKDIIWEGDLPVLLEPGAAFMLWEDSGSPVRYRVTMRGLSIELMTPVYMLYVAKQ